MSLLASGLLYASLLVLLAVISATETAIHSLRDLSTGENPDATDRIARRFRSVVSNPFPHLHRALLLSTTLNLSLAAIGLHLVTGPFAAMAWNPWLSAMVLFLATVLLGDMVPKFLAARSPELVLQSSLQWLSPLRAIIDPVIGVTDRAAEAILGKLIPKDLKMRAAITRDEFDTLVEMREEQGQIDADEASLIREVLEVEALDVRDCMIPRNDVPLVATDWPDVEALALLENPPARFVVVHGETPDAVEGVIDTQAWKLSGRPAWRNAVSAPQFVPETMPVLDALESHLSSPSTALLITDEYGGIEGIITQAQVADWVLHDAAPWQGEDSEILDLGGGRHLMEGGTRLSEIAEELGLPLSAEGVDTIGGYVFNTFGRVPKAGERLSLPEDAELKVRRVVKARIQQVEIRLATPVALADLS